ncbi:MAG: hypothetical protein Q9223_007261 [Gallowayella weberi]
MSTINGLRDSRTAAIVFGSETGNALDYAEEAGRLLERQGDLPANARSFWKKLLRKRLPPDYLQHVNITTFGLGDSSYPKFNWAARKLQKRLTQLGAYEFLPRGEADEQHEEGLDATWVPWSADLRRLLLEKYPLVEGIQPVSEDVLLQPKCLLSLASSTRLEGVDQVCNGDDAFPVVNGIPIPKQDASVLPAPRKVIGDTSDRKAQQILVRVEENKRLTPSSHWQDVRHFNLSCTSFVDYDPGDILTIYPQNSWHDVDQIIELMGWDRYADQPIQFESTNKMEKADFYPVPPAPFHKLHSEPLTLRKVLIHYLDVRAIPRRSFFSMIAHFTNDAMHKERLLEFTDPQYIDELYDYTTRPRRSILEVLQEFDSVKIPWQWAANVVPNLRGRQFSVASGGSSKHIAQDQTNFEILAAIVRYKTVLKRLREGVCTRYIAGLPIGTNLNVTIQKGGLNMHRAEASRPVIMIGPGTGVAPMRSLIWERYRWHQEMLDGRQDSICSSANGFPGVGDTVLFYGGRNREADFFYHQEWHELKEKMPLQVFTAFSRDQPEKIYVQNVLKEQCELVYHLLHDQEGVVYVCGSSGKMPQLVRAALVEIFQACGRTSSPAAENYLQRLEREGRYKQETW